MKFGSLLVLLGVAMTQDDPAPVDPATIYKLVFITRPERKLDNERFSMFPYIKKEGMVALKQVPFAYDFTFDQVIMKASEIPCNNSYYCTELPDTKTDTYQDTSYDYTEVNGFLGVGGIWPAEINEDQAKFLSQNTIRISSSSTVQNVVGMAPNSYFWTLMNNEYFYFDNQFNVMLSRYPDFELFRFYAMSNPDVGISIDPAASLFTFQKTLSFNQDADKTFKDVNYCVGNQKNRILSLETTLYQTLSSYLCQGLCSSPDKIVKSESIDLGFLKLPISQLYTVQKGNVVLNFFEKDGIYL